jgi:hypothetical protein
MNTHSNEARGDPVGPFVKLSICRFTACLADSGVVRKEECGSFKIVGKIHTSPVMIRVQSQESNSYGSCFLCIKICASSICMAQDSSGRMVIGLRGLDREDLRFAVNQRATGAVHHCGQWRIGHRPEPVRDLKLSHPLSSGLFMNLRNGRTATSKEYGHFLLEPFGTIKKLDLENGWVCSPATA